MIICQLLIANHAAEFSGSGFILGILVAVPNMAFSVYFNTTIGIVLLVFKSNIASLIRWTHALKSQPELLDGQNLKQYWNAVELANENSTKIIFNICTIYTIDSIAMLYRFFAFGAGK